MEQWYMWQETLQNLEFGMWVIRSLSAETSKDICGIVKGYLRKRQRVSVGLLKT